MQYTITISGRNTADGTYSDTVSASQLNMVLTIDKTLDYGSFVVRNERPEPFEVGDVVDIDITDGIDTESYHFIVSADDVTQLPKGYFVHTVTIIELTKILEWQKDSNRSFTQKLTGDRLTLLDVVVALQSTLPLEQTANIATTRVFAIDSDLQDRLQAIESPEFQFTNRNLKEMLFEIFDFVGAIPRLIKVSNDFVLTGDFYNELGELITSDSFYRMKRLDISEFSTALDSDIRNLFDDSTIVVDPAPGQFKFLTSEAGQLTEDNAIIKTDYPIVEVLSLVIDIGDEVFDITDSIVEKEEFDQLDNVRLTESISTGRFRDNTFFFTRYQNNIGNLFDAVRGTTGTNNRLDAVVLAARVKNSQAVTREQTVNDFRDVSFRIEYKSLLDTRVQAKRMDTGVIKYDSQVTTGQSGNIIRADRALDRLFKLQQLLGNASIMTSERITSLNELHKLGDFKDDDFVVTTIEMICEKNHILTKYMFSQNFQKVSEFVDVDSEIRLYDIPARTFRRNLYIEDIVEIDLEPRPNTSFITADGINTFANTIRSTVNSTHNTPVGLFVYDNKEIPGVDTENKVLIKTQTAYTGGNSLNFHAEFDNPKIAGFQLDTDERNDDTNDFDLIDTEFEQDPTFLESLAQSFGEFFTTSLEATKNNFRKIADFIGVREPGKNVGINYTDIFGEVLDFGFQFAQTTNLAAENRRFLPVAARNEIVRPLIVAPNHRLLKDARENLAITYALHVLPVKGLETRVIVGKYLVERNNLLNFIPTTSNQFEVFTSDRTYSITENAFSRVTDDNSTIIGYSVVPYSVGGVVSGFRVGLTAAIDKAVTWGIRKKDTRELVLVVNAGDFAIGVENPPTSNALHFTFNDRQSFVQYPTQAFTPPLFLLRPTDFVVVGTPTSTNITLSWTDPNDPVTNEYEIEISTNLTQWQSFTTTTTTRTFTGLASGTQFTFRLRAALGDLYSEYIYINASTAEVDPNQVQNLQARIIGQTSISVSFDELDNVFAYFIQISESNTFIPLLADGQKRVTENRFIFSPLNTPAIEVDKTYFIRVRAIRGVTLGAFSNTVSVSTRSLPITAAPEITNVLVEPNFVQYTVINRNGDFATLFADLVDGSTQRQTLVPPNESIQVTQAFTNEIRIFAKAIGARGQSFSEIVVEQFIDLNPPVAPNIGAVGIVVNSAFNVVNYTYAGPIVDGFVAERNPNAFNQAGFGEVSLQLSPLTRRFIDLTPLSGETYTYRIRAFNRAGNAVSNERTVTSVATVPNAPSNLTASVVLAGGAGEGFFTLQWQRNSTDEDGFLVQRKLSTQGAGSFADVGGTSKGQTTIDQVIQGPANTTYDYRIIAFNQFGNSTASNTVSVFIA